MKRMFGSFVNVLDVFLVMYFFYLVFLVENIFIELKISLNII